MDAPEEDSDDWLWYKPESSKEKSWRLWQDSSEEEFCAHFRHDPCEITFYALVTPHNRIQCWACGKYLRKPKY